MDKHITINNFERESQKHCHICMEIGSHTPLFLFTPDRIEWATEDTWLCMTCADVEVPGWD